LPKDVKVLSYLGFSSNVLPGPLTDLSAWGDFAPQAQRRVSNINFMAIFNGIFIASPKNSKYEIDI
jgi:hypothetical protein